MSRKLIPYPVDYKNTASVRRARRGGNAFVIVLCVLIALLLGAGTFFALVNDGQGWDKLIEFGKRVGADCPFACGTQKTTPVSEQPQVTPQPTEQPNLTEPSKPTEQPKTTESPKPAETPKPSPVPQTQPDPDLESHLAPAFDLSELQSIPDVVDAVTPGVVGVLNYKLSKDPDAEPRLAGSGSGFIYSDNGYIITNQHVVEGAALLKVSLKNGEVYEARLVGSDIMTDVAVLKIDAEGLTALPIGDSSKARVGEFVLAIGDPISADELSGSVTFGIISALSRQINIEGFENEYLQTDAAVNPGNSGGPLINMRGEVVGVTSAKYTSAGVDENGQTISSEGIGFALPINNVVEIAKTLILNGSTVRPGIGITVISYTQTDDLSLLGVFVYGVTEGGPADVAGAKVGDKVLMLDGVAVESQDAFINAVRNKIPGDTIVLTVERDGEQIELSIVVGDLNQIHK